MQRNCYIYILFILGRFEPSDGLVTKTINKGEDVTLSVSSVNGGHTPLWRRIRNGNVSYVMSSGNAFTVSSLDVMDGDLFSVIQSSLSVNDNHFAMIRMIVRGKHVFMCMWNRHSEIFSISTTKQ